MWVQQMPHVDPEQFSVLELVERALLLFKAGCLRERAAQTTDPS